MADWQWTYENVPVERNGWEPIKKVKRSIRGRRTEGWPPESPVHAWIEAMRSRRMKSRLVSPLTDAMFVLIWSKVRISVKTQKTLRQTQIHCTNTTFRESRSGPGSGFLNTILKMSSRALHWQHFLPNVEPLVYCPPEISVFVFGSSLWFKVGGKRWCQIPHCTNQS